MKTIRPLFFGLLLAGLASGCASLGGSAVVHRAFREDMQEGNKLVQTGHYRQAVDELSMLLEMDPRNEEARLVRAVAYQALEELPLAIEDYETVLKGNPDSAKAHYNLGMIYAFKLDDPRRALGHFDRFLSLEPDHPKAFAVAKIMCSVDNSAGTGDPVLDEALQRAGQIPNLEERKSRIGDLARESPGSPLPHLLLGKTYEFEGEGDQAIESYRTAIEIQPTCAPCQQRLGKALLGRRKTAREGMALLRKAELFNPNRLSNTEP